MVCKRSQQWQQYVVCLPEWLWTCLLSHWGDLVLRLKYMGGFNGSSKTRGCVKPMCAGMWKHHHISIMAIEHWLLSSTEEETFLTLSKELNNRSLTEFQSVRVTGPLYQEAAVTWELMRCLATGTQFTVPSTVPMFPNLFDPLSASNLHSFANILLSLKFSCQKF